MRLPQGVGATSLMTAYARAQESRRADAIFLDRWAEACVDAATGHRSGPLPPLGFARDEGASTLWREFGSYLALRTVFYDEHLLKASRDGLRQVVLLAAGMDARAYRLVMHPGSTVFELDHDDVFAFKEEVFAAVGEAPTCPRRLVVADLLADWPAALLAAGFDPGESTVWLAEGLLMYLSPEDADQLMATLTGLSAPGSRIISEYPDHRPSTEFFTSRCTDDADRRMAAGMSGLLQAGPSEEPSVWLRRHGWIPEVTEIAAFIASLGRPVPPICSTAPDACSVWLFAGQLT